MKKKKKTLSFLNYIAILLVIVSLLTASLVYFIDILPANYFIVFVSVLFIMNTILIFFLKTKSKLRNILGVILSILLSAVEIIGIMYSLNTIDFLKQFGFNNYKTENYNVIVLNSSSYSKLNELKDTTIGHLETNKREGLKEMLAIVKNKIDAEYYIGTDTLDLVNSLIAQNLSAIILEEAELSMLAEDYNDLYQQLKIIYTNEIETELKDITKEVDVTSSSYNIYISGIDTYGSVTKVSRSDVNILVTVNPTTNKILLTSIPRDYYVLLDGYDEYDKLTHAGVYGIETSVGTLENLLDTDINYYVKVNFTSLINVVDTLGGIEVDSPYAFTSKDGYYYKKGINELNGKKALSFVRERNAFAGGDRTRGENQKLVLTALIEKAMQPNVITKYSDLLDDLEGNFITNISDDNITKFIKYQIKEGKDWEIAPISLDGKDTYKYTYTHKSNPLYVMEPYEESVQDAIIKIAETLKVS